MKTIGIRVEPKCIHYAIFNTEDKSIEKTAGINVPLALEVPEMLKYLRNSLLDILTKYQIEKAGIRKTESFAQNLSVARIEIEGVIQETFASSELKGYYVGEISTISAKAGINRDDFKRYVNGELNYPGTDKWSDICAAQREAVITAIGANNV